MAREETASGSAWLLPSPRVWHHESGRADGDETPVALGAGAIMIRVRDRFVLWDGFSCGEAAFPPSGILTFSRPRMVSACRITSTPQLWEEEPLHTTRDGIRKHPHLDGQMNTEAMY